MVLFNICPDLNFNYIGGNKRTKLKLILFRPFVTIKVVYSQCLICKFH